MCIYSLFLFWNFLNIFKNNRLFAIIYVFLLQVLYEQLDYFLDCDETLKKLVYAKNDPFDVMDQFIPPESIALEQLSAGSENNEPNVEVNISASTTDNVEAATKKSRRGKKKKKNGCDDPLAGAAEEVVLGLLSDELIVQNVQDELTVISANLHVNDNDPTTQPTRDKKKKPIIVVPPDMLSECSDVSDAESCSSDTLDLDTALEDRSFFNAQRKAAAKQAAAAAAAGQEQTSTASSGQVKIIDITDDPVLVNELKEKSKATELDNHSEEKELKKTQKKRISTAERLFGDKLKQNSNKSNQNRKDDKCNKTAELNKLMNDVAIKPNAEEIQVKVTTSETVIDGSTQVKQEPGNSNGTESLSGFDYPPQQGMCATPPRFMVSPYNQQVNFSPGQARAENNWFNHPMLNNFSNAPPQTGFQISGRYQQQHLNQNIRQQPHYNQTNRQQEKHNSGQQVSNNRQHHQVQRANQQSCPGGFSYSPGQQQQPSRTVPTVEQVMRLSNWSRYVQKVGFVVYIREYRNTRLGAGTLKPFADMNQQFALFSPNDGRIPRMKIPMEQCPSDLFARRQDYAKKIYLAKITRWTDYKFALGLVMLTMTNFGSIKLKFEN